MFTSLIKKKKVAWKCHMFMCLKSCCFLGSTTSSSTLHNEAEVGDDDVFTVSTCHSPCKNKVILHGQVGRGFSF